MPMLIPQPAAFKTTDGAFTLTPATIIRIQTEANQLFFIARQLSSQLPFQLDILSGEPQPGEIWLHMSDADPSLGQEGYRLEVRSDGITAEALAPAGLYHAIQTLRQLLPPSAGQGRAGSHQIGCLTIRDAPRFPWRGMMLDVARHFFGVEVVKRLVDLLAFYKFNRLHLHLSDDQGWRIEIKRWPRLAEYGGRSAVNGDSGGYFTQEQYVEIVAYASERYITVVPEIDMPGHTNAALASIPELNVEGQSANLYEGIEVGFSTLTIQKEFTYRFLDEVVTELAALTPGPYFHIGGDETHSTPEADYKVFVERVQRIVQTHGKQMIGWEEIGKTCLSPESLAQYWWDRKWARAAVRQGNQIILSPAKRIYLDIKYNPSTSLGLLWPGSPTSVRKSYNWDPAKTIPGVPEDAILGVEAALWSETTRTQDDLDYMIFPRLCGVAEIGWSPQEVRRWEDYRLRLAAHGRWLETMGVKFYRSTQVRWEK